MSQECKAVHIELMKAGFRDLGYCSSCPARIRRYVKGAYMIKTYGTRCTMRLFHRNKLIRDNVVNTKVQELIQETLQAG